MATGSFAGAEKLFGPVTVTSLESNVLASSAVVASLYVMVKSIVVFPADGVCAP